MMLKPFGWIFLFLVPQVSFQMRINSKAGGLNTLAGNKQLHVFKGNPGDDQIWDWKGIVKHIVVTWPSGDVQTVNDGFIALAGRARSSACKLAVHSEASVQMTQNVKETKGTMVGQVKGFLMMLCMALADDSVQTMDKKKEALNSCVALGFTSVKGVQRSLASMAIGSGNPNSNDAGAMHLISKSHHEDLLKLLRPDGPVGERILRLTKKILQSVKVYACLVNHEAADFYNDEDQANATGKWGKTKGFIKRVARGFWKTPLQRLSAKLAKSEENESDRQLRYFGLLERILPKDALDNMDCEDSFLREEILVMKGAPDTRLGSVDLMSIASPDAKRRREVKIESADRHSIVLSLWDTLMDNDLESKPIIIKLTAQDETHVISHQQNIFGALEVKLRDHIKECVVEKVGVFNVQMKSRVSNKFTFKEQNSWKVLFFSKMAIEVMTKSAEGGYDLYGDPEELSQPCKWKARAMIEGKYRPISNFLQFAKDVGEVVSAGENLTFMNVETDDPDSFLWMDQDDKIVLPEWARATEGLFNCKVMDCNGRSSSKYLKGFAHDVRGLIDADKAIPVLETLVARFDWSMDPVFNWHLKLRYKKGQASTDTCPDFVFSGYCASNHTLNCYDTAGGPPRGQIPQCDVNDAYTCPSGMKKCRQAQSIIVSSENLAELRANRMTEPLQLSSSLVSAIYEADEMSASIAFVNLGEIGKSEASSLWSVYDYYEGYRDNCFMFDGGSINDANDDLESFADSQKRSTASRWFLDVPFGSTMRLCTNNFDGSFENRTRTVVSQGGVVNRDEIVRDLLSFFSRDRKHGNPVADHEVRSCRSSTDGLFNTCFQADSCVENPKSPCPKGFACDCDVSARGTAMKVGMAISVIVEGTVYMDWSIQLFGGFCVTAVTAMMMPYLAAACPVVAGALSYIQAPFGTNTPVVIAGISLFMGMSSCGCVPMTCSSGAMISSGNSNRVCALRHPSDLENQNPLAFVPPPGLKCVQEAGTLGFDTCKYRSCSGAEMRESKIGWDQRDTSKRRVTEIFNCQSPDRNTSESEYATIFDEQTYIDQRPDDIEIREGLVPRPPEEVKLSSLFSLRFWTRLAGSQGKALRKCFWSYKTRTNLKVTRLGWVGQLSKFPLKLIMSPLCLAKIALSSSLSLAAFLLDYLMGAAVQAIVSTIKLLEKINVNLQRTGRWWQYCDTSGNKLQGPPSIGLEDLLKPDSDEPSESEEIDEIESLMNTTNGQMVAELFEQVQTKIVEREKKSSLFEYPAQRRSSAV